MKIKDIYAGDRVLVQSGTETKEHADVLKVLADDKVLVKLTNFDVVEMKAEYILKNFSRP